eukprot:TCALIF_11565-PA protein Name:"Similar to Tigd4 Tigger transposable element-derived protein 4 (Mus musculus)" AED:0.09 eAED:0.11 QI:0/-1/0/1/-1/1/1/0/119
MSEKRKRNDLDFSEKQTLAKKLKELGKVSQREAATTLGVSRSLIRNIQKGEIDVNSNQDPLDKKKRKRHGKDKQVKEALFKWFQFVRSRSAPVNGPILCQKATEIAQKLGHETFKPTEG